MAIGTSFKILFDKDSKSTNLISGIDLVKSELEFLLSTPKYSLFFGNTLGQDLEKYIYLSNKQAIHNLIKDDLTKLFDKYSKAYLIRVDTKFNKDTNNLEINLVVSLDPEGKTTTDLTFTIGDEVNKPISPKVENYVTFESDTPMRIEPYIHPQNIGVRLQYSIDNGKTWIDILSTNRTQESTKILFRGEAKGRKALTGYFENGVGGDASSWYFYNSTNLRVSGDLMYLLCDNIGDRIPPTYVDSGAFYAMFSEPNSESNIKEFNGIISATTLASYCYTSMFSECTNLVKVNPKMLPSTTLANYCYRGMFQDCTNLIIAPELPAPDIPNIYCYSYMFVNCNIDKVYLGYTGTDRSYFYHIYNGSPMPWLSGITTNGILYKKGELFPDTTDILPPTWTQQPWID